MKKVLIVLVVGIVLFGACSAQNANAQSANNEQRIIGTWVENGRTTYTWVFNANGILTRTDSRDGSVTEGNFGVTGTMVAFKLGNYSSALYSFSISSDGKTLIMNDNKGDGYWLTKK